MRKIKNKTNKYRCTKTKRYTETNRDEMQKMCIKTKERCTEENEHVVRQIKMK